MFPQRFDQARPFATLALVGLVWLLLPAAIKRMGHLTLFELQAPVAATASYVRDLQDFWSLRTRSQTELIEAGRDLARLNASYEVRLQEDARLREEVERLEALLDLPAPENYRAEPARVVRRDFSGWWQQLVVRKGRQHGILKGSPVIFTGGVVGRIEEVGLYTSVVQLISDPRVRIAASIEGDNRPVSYQGGNNPTMGPARGAVDFVPIGLYVSPSETKRVVTSGLGGMYPPGLTIGQLVKLDASADGLFQTGDVRLDERLASVSEVTILVPVAATP